MLGVPLDKRVRRVLGVTVDEGLSLTLDDTPGAYFPANVTQPQSDNGLLDGSPRTSKSVWRLYWQRPPAEIHACDRIEVPGDTTYELISAPRKVNNGRRVVGYSAPMLPVDQLYPRSADVKDMGKADALATIACCLYSERGEQRGRGEYHGTFAEAPASAWEAISSGANRELHFSDGSVWKITDATLAPELPYVSMTVRKAG